MTLKSMHYGMEFADQFAREANRVRFDEVLLFRALRKAILATSPCFPVEELHGARSRVVFPACPPWTKATAQCELSDLCIVWFRRRPSPLARITFLQAKLSKGIHAPCAGRYPASTHEDFVGDSTQWYLLNKRPAIRGSFHNFRPPANLLKDALLPSIATYCVFHQLEAKGVSFFYASADIITAGVLKKPGRVNLNVSAASPIACASGFIEQKWSCCPAFFGEALFSGRIGTPFHHDSAAIDARWRSSVLSWLGSILADSIRNGQIGPVLRAFITTFSVPHVEVATAAPARALLFIQGDEEKASE